ncbi:hypothetical protein GH714_019119 [Hevea brasiliensis]|uniref:PB1-like domain-containing protein n=1 Tax=Hevea brasiliensis TaxID=3981 RepID=A0A6A6K7D8_HEVBR|nr:hypothetical protein GH714_019119 [Hevea brasiliensis]
MIGNLDMWKTKIIRYHYGGHFVFSPKRYYVSRKIKEKCDIDIDYIAYFDLLHHLKEEREFNIMEGDKFYYLQAMSTLADHDGLIEIVDDGNVQNVLASYKRYGWKLIEIYALLREYDIVPTTPEEHNVTNNNFEEMTQGVPKEVVGHVSDTSDY